MHPKARSTGNNQAVKQERFLDKEKLAAQCNPVPADRTLTDAARVLEEQTSEALARLMCLRAALFGGPGAPPREEVPMADGLDKSLARSLNQMDCVLDILSDIQRRQ